MECGGGGEQEVMMGDDLQCKWGGGGGGGRICVESYCNRSQVTSKLSFVFNL